MGSSYLPDHSLCLTGKLISAAWQEKNDVDSKVDDANELCIYISQQANSKGGARGPALSSKAGAA